MFYFLYKYRIVATVMQLGSPGPVYDIYIPILNMLYGVDNYTIWYTA
jgi:hypothetical protein